MKGFLERLQWKLSGMMQGRRGADTFSNFLVVAGIVLLFASLIPGLDLLSWVALIVLAYSLFRSYSKNIAARDRENATFERIVEKPRKQLSLMRKKWTNRKTNRRSLRLHVTDEGRALLASVDGEVQRRYGRAFSAEPQETFDAILEGFQALSAFSGKLVR